MKWLITHGSIASVLFVTTPDEKKLDCFYIAEGRLVQVGVSGTEADAENRFLALPMEVRAAVNKQFGIVFSLPVHCRGDWVKAQLPFEVEVPETLPTT